MPPVSARDIDPPVVRISQVDGPAGLLEDDRRSREQFWLRAWIVVGIGGPLRERDVMRFFNESCELPIRHSVAAHPEPPDFHVMCGRFLRIVMIGSHQKRAARNPDHHLRGWWTGR